MSVTTITRENLNNIPDWIIADARNTLARPGLGVLYAKLDFGRVLFVRKDSKITPYCKICFTSLDIYDHDVGGSFLMGSCDKCHMHIPIQYV